jgi:hypothetical protein
VSDPVVKIPTIKLTPVPGGVNVVQYGTLTIGSVETLEAGSAATVSNSGTIEKAVLDFGIPAGFDGKDGAAATVAIGTVTTGEPGSNASVTNVGTDTAAILDISIPRGDKGADGAGAGDVIAAADNTFTATNTFDGTLKTTCDMQHYSQTIGGTMTLDSSSDNLQTLYVTNDAATIRFTDPDMPDVYKKTFIVDVHRTGSGVFSVATDNNIGGNAATAYIIGGTLPDIAAGEILKLGVEISTEVNAVYVYVIGKVVL